VRLAWPLAITVAAMPALAQYAGPAILSRGDAPSSMSAPEVDFRPYVNIAASYATGLSSLQSSSQGTTLGNVSSAGVLLSFGLSGTHSWKHTKVGVDYAGSISHYNDAAYGGYDNQSFLLSVSHQFSPHTSFSLRNNASITSQPFSLPVLPQTVTFDPASTSNPTTDFYDNRTISLGSYASLTFQKSTRLSFNFGGQGGLTERQGGVGLYSTTSAGATGDVQYRLTGHTTVGGLYSYTHFEYHGTFNATDVQGLSGTYAIQLSRSLEFSGFGGFSQIESKFLENVPLSPALASLIGFANGVVIDYTHAYHPAFSGRLSRSFPRGVAFLSSAYSVTPGNGLFLTSTSLTNSVGYSYTGLRLWSLGAGATYLRANSIANVTGRYGDIGGNLSASRQVGRFLHVTLNWSAMKYQSGSFAGYNRLTYAANLGLAFSPGDIPLRVW